MTAIKTERDVDYLLPVPGSDWAVLIPVLNDGLVVDVFPQTVIAWVLRNERVIGVVTPFATYDNSVALFGPEGVVESPQGHWPSLVEYGDWLKRHHLH